MHNGTLIFAIIVAILIIRFLGFTIFLWCIPLTILIILICFFYPILRDEYKFPDLEKLPNKLWKKYKKVEPKIFKWIDDFF
ncbi:MAG: hypothetical protein AAB493_00845 [Patescibacteria group bacterium]